MSGFVVNENIKRFPKIINFIEFTTLSEAIEPVAITYGKNYFNKEWNVYGDFKCTFYIYKNRSYCVVIDGFNVGFMTADHIVPIEKIDELDDIEDFGFDRVRVSEACRTFNHFFYIILQGIVHFNLDHIVFHGADPELDNFYSKIVKNKFFVKQLEKVGLKYIKDDFNVEYIFYK